jgi:hypothetical protein
MCLCSSAWLLQARAYMWRIKTSRDFITNRFFPFCVFWPNSKKFIKNHKQIEKMQNQFCWFPCGRIYNFCKIWPYFLLIYFAWKIEICLTLICCSSKYTGDLKLHFGYVVRHVMCMLYTKICINLLSKYFNMIYFVFMVNLLRWILQLKINTFLCPTSEYSLHMPRLTSGELIMSL